jgi:dihydrofolate reductase
MILSLVYAQSENGAIGKNNQLLWHLPADLRFFKANTLGCPVIMGRRTFESIGRALPGRKNIVITRDVTFNAAKQFDITVVSSVEAALDAAQPAERVCVIGGGEIYRQTLPVANEILRTLVHHHFEGDAYAPELGPEFRLVWEEAHKADEKNKYDYTFQKLIRE